MLPIVFEPPSPKNRFFWPKTVFLGPEWSVVGPHTLFCGCWTPKKVFPKVLEQMLEGFRAAITRKPHFSAKSGHQMHFLA